MMAELKLLMGGITGLIPPGGGDYMRDFVQPDTQFLLVYDAHCDVRGNDDLFWRPPNARQPRDTP